MMEETLFKLVGLRAGGMFTLLDLRGDHFWAESDMTKKKFSELFQWAKTTEDFWSGHAWYAMVRHDGIKEDGSPSNPRVLYVQENN